MYCRFNETKQLAVHDPATDVLMSLIFYEGEVLKFVAPSPEVLATKEQVDITLATGAVLKDVPVPAITVLEA